MVLPSFIISFDLKTAYTAKSPDSDKFPATAGS